jgi:hypothetical protein
MNIPTEIEKDIKSGKARYQTFQTGIGGQSVLKVPPNSYIIIYGYDFSPAGGGLQVVNRIQSNITDSTVLHSATILPFETQQISFYTGQAFHPFVHHVNVAARPYIFENNEETPSFTQSTQCIAEVDNTPQEKDVYIISGSNVAITVGLMNIMDEEGAGVLYGPIGITNNTPNAITYGGDGNTHGVQSFLSSATQSVFTQPSVEDVDFYSTGFTPQPNAEAQVYLKPEPGSVATGVGLIDPSEYIQSLDAQYPRFYSLHYYLNVHYALYTNQTPEQLG